jgi:hypothetical protein
MECFNSTDSGSPFTPREVQVGLETPSEDKGNLLFIFFSLSARSNLASILVEDGKCTEGESDPGGNVTVQMGNCSVKFKSWCPPCMLPICFQVFARTQVKVCSDWFPEGGWCLLGQGEFLRTGLLKLRHTPLELEGDSQSLISVKIIECPKDNVNALPRDPKLLELFDKWVEEQSRWRSTLPFNNPSFLRISHPWIAVHCGNIPRDLYYWKGIKVSPKVLMCR